MLNKKGQAMVEAALTAPIIAFFLFTIIWFGEVFLSWQQIVTAARYGTDLIGNTPFSKEYIEKDIQDYLCNENNIGRILDPERLKITIEIKDFPKLDYTVSLSEINKLFQSITNSVQSMSAIFTGNNNSFVEITYKYKYPSILKLAGKDTFELRARSEILSGTGSAGAKERE
ncbi:MAG: pilus assembly protein [Elusimicrobiota bacterium]|nr:pilus assembly protein [Elusimicrobiota bacterium]